MGTKKRELYFVAAVLAVTLVGGGYYAGRHRAAKLERAQAHMGTWLESPRAMAKVMMERYGPPDTLAPEVAIWYGRSPWKRIAVHGDAPLGYLEQTVGYQVPAAAAAPLRRFDHGLRFSLDDKELSATSNSEALNILSLNLADELVAGKRAPEETGEFYVRTARLAAAGKSSPYLEKLRFEPYSPLPARPWDREIGY